jgi:hypothetical protein
MNQAPLLRRTELAQSKLIWKFCPWLEPYKTCRQPIKARSPFISRARCRSISTFKQKLLTMRSETERIQAVAAYFESILPNLHRAARAREKAGGNGHAR